VPIAGGSSVNLTSYDSSSISKRPFGTIDVPC